MGGSDNINTSEWRETAASMIGDEDLVLLLSALRDDDVAERDPRVEQLVLTIHGRIDKLLPWNVAEALGELRDPRVVEPLLEILAVGPPLVRSRAAVALGVMRERRAVEPLSALVCDNHVDVVLRTEAAVALAQIGDPRAVAPLLDSLRTDGLGGQAGHSLNALGEPSFAALVEALHDAQVEVRLRAIDALCWRKDPRVVDPLAATLMVDPDDEVRTEAAQALAEQREPGILALLEGIKHERAEVRRVAAWALREVASPLPNGAARIPSPAEVRAHLLPLLDDHDAAVRRLAAATLRFLGYWAPHALPSPLGPEVMVGTVYASHLQFFLRDAAYHEIPEDDFDSDEAYARGLAVDPRGSLRIFTTSYGWVPVAIEAVEGPPDDALYGWTRVVEASIAVSSGALDVDWLFGKPGEDPNIRIAVSPGAYRVRLYVGNGGENPIGEDDDYYRFVIWPVASLDAPPLVLHQEQGP